MELNMRSILRDYIISHIKSGGFFIFRKLGNIIEFLTLKYAAPKYHWTQPKGIINEGDDALETAFRKTKEKTSYTPNDLFVYNEIPIEITYAIEGGRKTVTYYLAELKDPFKDPILSEEHTTYLWMDMESTRILVEHQQNGAVLEEFYEFITSGKAEEFKRKTENQ